MSGVVFTVKSTLFYVLPEYDFVINTLLFKRNNFPIKNSKMQVLMGPPCNCSSKPRELDALGLVNFFIMANHKVHIYLEFQSVCPLVRIGTPPSPPEPKGGGGHSPAGEGLGESQFRRLEKKLSTLSTLLCGKLMALRNSVIHRLVFLSSQPGPRMRR